MRVVQVRFSVEDYPGTPGWVYVFGIIVIVLVLVFLAVHVAGGGLGRQFSHGS